MTDPTTDERVVFHVGRNIHSSVCWELITTLRAERDGVVRMYNDTLGKFAKAEARVEELEGALRPFSTVGARLNDNLFDEDMVFGPSNIQMMPHGGTVGEYRTAVRVMSNLARGKVEGERGS